MDIASLSPDAPPINLAIYDLTIPILHVMVVYFHHRNGPIVEYVYPPLPPTKEHSTKETTSYGYNGKPIELPSEWNYLPFFALPDGAHMSVEDFVYFHLPPVDAWPHCQNTTFGISCYRQMNTADLIVKDAEMTRNQVQKSVVIIARQPLFGILTHKLSIVTETFFAQRDFSTPKSFEIIRDLYNSLIQTIGDSQSHSLQTLYSGTSLRHLIHKYRRHTLTLFKALLLERRILFYGAPVEALCTYQYSLVTLVPGLLNALHSAGAAHLSHAETQVTTDASLTSATFGLPLPLFSKGKLFQPYLPLQQIDEIKPTEASGYLVGVTNRVFLNTPGIDIVAWIDTGAIEIKNEALKSSLSLSYNDKKFMDEIISKVICSLNNTDEKNVDYVGSEEWIRAKFEDYLLRLLSTWSHAVHYKDQPASNKEHSLLNDYGMGFTNAWMLTDAHINWSRTVQPNIHTLIAVGHPYAGASQFADATAKTKAQANEQLKQARSSMTKLWKNWKEGGNEKSIASSSAENLPEPFSNETSTLSTPSHSHNVTPARSLNATPVQGNNYPSISEYLAKKKEEAWELYQKRTRPTLALPPPVIMDVNGTSDPSIRRPIVRPGLENHSIVVGGFGGSPLATSVLDELQDLLKE